MTESVLDLDSLRHDVIVLAKRVVLGERQFDAALAKAVYALIAVEEQRAEILTANPSVENPHRYVDSQGITKCAACGEYWSNHPGKCEVKIIVNCVEHLVPVGYANYPGVLRLAGDPHAFGSAITYRGPSASGHLLDDDSDVKLENGMVFNVTRTSAA